MNCSEYEALLYGSIEESIGHVDAVRMTAHELSCPRCRRLAALIACSDAPPSPEPIAGLTESVLERTSGKSCEEVAVLFAEGCDATPDALWPVHVESCRDCRALQGAMARMLHEIPELAALDPDVSLVDSVLQATGRRRPAASAPRRREGLWLRFVQRPRAALEGAYVAAMLLLVITGLPWALSVSPARALDAWWRGRAEAANDLSASMINAVEGSVQGTWQQLRAPELKKFGPQWNQKGSGSVEQDNTDRNGSGT